MIPSSGLALCIVLLDAWVKIMSQDIWHPGDKFILDFTYVLRDETTRRLAHLGNGRCQSSIILQQDTCTYFTYERHDQAIRDYVFNVALEVGDHAANSVINMQ